MKAMILAAGEGTRLRPLTTVCPKALMPVVNKPVMGRVIEFLKAHGIREIMVNAHHHYQKLVDYLQQGDPFDIKIEIRVEKEILGTGGGIRNTRDFWDRAPFVVINGDVLTDIDLREVYDSHLKRNNLVTMVLHDFPVHNKVKVDGDMNIVSIGRDATMAGALAFTGIHVISPEVLGFIPEGRPSDIIECYRRLIDLRKQVRGYVVAGHRWIDMGTIHDYLKANFSLLPPEKMSIADGCHLDTDAAVRDWAVIGEGCSIEKGAVVKRSVLWDNVIIREGIRVVDSVVASGVVGEEDILGNVAVR
jgi:NDP-sugar pyrophosphorylase family protein